MFHDVSKYNEYNYLVQRKKETSRLAEIHKNIDIAHSWLRIKLASLSDIWKFSRVRVLTFESFIRVQSITTKFLIT